MIKISFWLKKPSTDKAKLEYISIGNPKKVSEGKFAGLYVCEVRLPTADENKYFPIYSSNPVDVLYHASNSAKIYLQNCVIKHGYKISEVENGEPWKEAWELESGEPELIFQRRLKRIKEAKNISSEGKQKILEVLKETFGKVPNMKGQFN